MFGLLIKTEKGAYSNLALDGALRNGDLSAAEKRFASRLFYGVTERKLTLDYILGIYGKKPVKKLDLEVLTALRMGLYQMLYCDGIPDSAAVNESVNLVRAAGKSSAAGYVNAVLRNIIRNGAAYELPKDMIKRLSAEYSCNEDIVRLLCGAYPREAVISLLASSFETSDLTVRVNTLKISADELAEKFTEAGAENVRFPDIGILGGKCLIAEGISGTAVNELRMYKDGLFHVQDISSQLCCEALAPKPGDTVIDLCAAPGGKTFTISELMDGRGVIYAGELHKKRADIIANGAARLGLENITAYEGNAAVFDEKLPQADKVLCDVPCSGLGVMRGKPEIKYKDVSDLSQLCGIQRRILGNASRYVKPGGVLVYSTCTLNPAENRCITEEFLNEHSDFEGEPFLEQLGKPFGGHSAEIFPGDFGSDGFYICRMRRKSI